MIRYVFNVGLLHPLLLAGLPGALSFMVRCATHLVRSGADISHVATMLGHSDWTTTLDHYTRLVPTDLHHAIRVMPEIPVTASLEPRV